MKRKLVSLLLAVSMTVALFAGCGNSEKAPADGNTADTKEEADKGEGTKTEDAEPEETAEIVVGLMCFAPVDPAVQDRVEAAVNEMMVEEINVTADIMWFDAATYATQIPMMIQSKEQLDVIMFTPVPAAGYSSFMSQGQLMDIAEYVDAYGADIKAVLGEEGVAATTKGDANYGVGGNLCRSGGEAILMRKDVLDEIGMTEKFENMKTWTEFEEILTAAKTAGYTGMVNGDAEGSTLTAQPFMAGSDVLEEAYWVDIAGDGNQQIYVDPTDDKVKCYYMNEDYKNNLIRAGEWYDKGLIHKDASTAEEYGDTLIKNGVGVAVISAIEFGWEGAKAASCGTEMLAKYTGARTKASTASYLKFGFGVPVTAQEPEAAVKFINLMYSKNDIHDTLCWGVKGTDWELKEDGTAGYIGDATSAEYHSNDFLYGDITSITPWSGSNPDLREQQKKENEGVEYSKYIGFAIDNTKVANQVTACQSVSNEYKPMISAGVYGAKTEEKWNEYIAALEAAGINDIVAEYQSQLDAWLAK